jgi:hypothetical protein
MVQCSQRCTRLNRYQASLPPAITISDAIHELPAR